MRRNREEPPRFGRASLPGRSERQDFQRESLLTKPFWTRDAVVLKQSGGLLALHQKFGGRAMWTTENDSDRSDGWDPALWSMGTAFAVAVVYLACLI